MQNTLRSLWSSFLVASGACGVFFTLFNPDDITILGEPVRLSRLGAYSIGFIAFWAIGVASSVLTLVLAKSAAEINRPAFPGMRGAAQGQDGLDREW